MSADVKKIGTCSARVVQPLPSQGFHETFLVDGISGYVFAEHIKHDPSSQRLYRK